VLRVAHPSGVSGPYDSTPLYASRRAAARRELTSGPSSWIAEHHVRRTPPGRSVGTRHGTSGRKPSGRRRRGRAPPSVATRRRSHARLASVKVIMKPTTNVDIEYSTARLCPAWLLIFF
jgi:hypothetical protein